MLKKCNFPCLGSLVDKEGDTEDDSRYKIAVG